MELDAKNNNLKIFDATCPLVTKVHLEAQKHEKYGKKIILIGHEGHPEVEGTSGRVKSDVTLVSSVEDVDSLTFSKEDNLAYVTQTTLSVDDTTSIINKLKEKFPNITGPDLKNICYATQNRQTATKEMAGIVDLILVIGSKNSSNSNRLYDIAIDMNKKAYLIDSFKDINLEWFKDVKKVGITAGASAPEQLVEQVINFIKSKFEIKINHLKVVEEHTKFKLPKELS